MNSPGQEPETGDFRRVLDDFAVAAETGRTPEEVQRERHSRELLAVARGTQGRRRWWVWPWRR